MRKSVIYGLFGLAILGLISQLIFNPSQLMKTIALVIFGATIIFLLFRLLFKNRFGSEEMRKYKQAAKQSRLKYKNSEGQVVADHRSKKTLRKRASHLRVIDGHKHK